AAAEASVSPPVDWAGLSDLSQPGPYAFSQRTLTVTNPALRQTARGLTVNYDFGADVYLPARVSAPVPLVIISHGFGAVKEDFIFLSQHLASHGYAVVVPDHVGSDLQYRQQYLNGRLNTLLSPIEFINRPREISYLIDQLEQLAANSPDWAGRLDLNRIAAIGDSLGSSTVMALAGATINYDRLVAACDRDTVILDFSLYLQCRARFLPPKNYDLSDPRIKAVIAAHNLGGPLYGPEGVARINIPIMMVSGSADVVAPVVTEQFAPFLWLTSPTRYLALLQVGTHFSSKPAGEGAEDVPSVFMGQHRDVGSSHYKTLATAFLGAHLRGESQFSPYLTAAYAQHLSQGQPMVVDLIRQLTADQVNAAYPGRPPVALVPPLPVAAVPPRQEPILETIKRSGELRIAMRRDAPPFGYGDDTTGWSGYCPNLALALRDHLTETLQTPVAIDLVEMPSTLDNRFDLVRDGQVYLECGPNTIRRDVPGIEFSNVIFATGTHFLTTPERASGVNPALSLAGVRVGVLANSTNQTLLQERYPEAAVTAFSGPTGRSLAVQAVYRGELDAFLGDDILTISEVLQQGLSTQNLTLVPEVPLSCEYYGLALPEDDPQWVATVNRFLAAEVGQDTWKAWLGQYTPYALDTLGYCLNR
ncbi:MAG: transporter substrate-binding domain-containing protein, partial [Cyanobacteriota bacterium]|nr:transporter substrate-binding domain-containing protein [Cyanobacteriota bacterium]